MAELFGNLFIVIGVSIVFMLIGIAAFYKKFYVKAEQGKALILTGGAKPKVSFSGLLVIPIFRRLEIMDISVKRIEIQRSGTDGLVCRDNMRADIKVAFFMRINNTEQSVMDVAQSIGTQRASNQSALEELFDAKFSEALKTVGKNFDFVELYQSRQRFKEEILQVIGTDLSGYVLEDCAIDYLEQTELGHLSPDNILDAEGIKKITELTSRQKVLSNQIDRDRAKTIKQQDVEAAEAILELDRQLAESKQKQQREIESIKAREEAETKRIQQEERRKAELARIQTDEEVQVATQNQERQVIVAQKNKQRTESIETERIEKDRLLEVVERERIVTLANIEKEKAVEEERKNIQDVIRERVVVEKAVVQEEEKIKDTRAFAEADRGKQVAVTQAQKEAEESLVKTIKAAEAEKRAAELEAEQKIIEAEAGQKAADKNAEARKFLAEAQAAEEAAIGLAETQVMEAKAHATEMQGIAEATVLEKKYLAEASGIQAKAEAKEREGETEANVLLKKYQSEATGIKEKAEAMRLFDGAGRDHEEFKLRLMKEKEIELSQIGIQKEIAEAQASVIREALKAAKIDIVGGESMFFEKIVGAVTQGKSVDRLVDNSRVLGDIKETFFTGDGEEFKQQLRSFVSKFGMSSEDLKNISLAALISKWIGLTEKDSEREGLKKILSWVEKLGLGGHSAEIIEK